MDEEGRRETNLRGDQQGCRHINPLNGELNPICHLLALLGGATIVVVSRLRVKNHTSIVFKWHTGVLK